jgi:hypothetical protein
VFSLKSESVFNFDQNQCSDWIRIGVQVGPEYATSREEAKKAIFEYIEVFYNRE